MVPRGTRPVRTHNADSMNYTIFLHTYYAMEFCPFPYLYRSYIRTHYTIHIFTYYIYVNEFHENDSAMRILTLILIDLVLLHKTCGIWNSSPSFAWALSSKIVRWEGFLWERVISNVCMFWHMFIWRLSVSKAHVEVRTSIKRLSFWLSFLAVIFPKWAESIPTGLKVFLATSPYSSSFWVSWGIRLLFMNCHSPNFLVLCCTTRCLRRTYLFFVSCILWYPFWAISIPL